MGLFDSLESMAATAMTSSSGDEAKVAGGFMQALQEHPGGVPAVLSSLQSNGLGEAVQQWTGGGGAEATPEQVQAGLGGTGLIEATAAKAGVSPEIAQMVLAKVMPMVLAHFAPGGEPAEHSALGGLAGGLLQKFL